MTEALSVFSVQYWSKGHIVTLQDELENIKNYLVIQNNRFKNKLFFKCLSTETKRIFYTAAFLSFYFSPSLKMPYTTVLSPKLALGTLPSNIHYGKRLIINVRDDGIGMDESDLQSINQKLRKGKYVDESTHGNGIALININQRIILNYGERYGITLASTKGVGSDVELTLPIIHNQDK